MSRTRDIIQEIGEIRKRRQFGSAMVELSVRLSTLEQAFESHKGQESELIRYFPVALIACVEGYFRMAIKDLIDSGDPYFSNAEKPASATKLDFSLLRAIHGKTITVGELVAHGVQLSRFEHISTALTNILGTDFLKGLEKVTDRWAHEVMGQGIAPILDNPGRVFGDVSRTFELRHIICHEIPSAYEIEVEEVARCFESCVAFLKAADEFISETLYPGSPLTQTDMNIAAGEALKVTEGELDKVIEKLVARLDESELVAFTKSQAHWDQYCEAWADFVAGDRAGGGTIWPVIYAQTAKATVEMRIQEVRGYRRLGESLSDSDD
ncbi:DUF1311 domain-containing protein [Pseudomonas syringae]|uniref:lysozyme inhibitor LprI family protein n=1 Tax=Pseudomonas syringae group TaxID=136849 RepID=UPI0022A6D6D3|nr:lysozyme inhibitor LprI family protein [Pseudomonas syringae group genomosp. 3]MCZ0947220.1 lysozyme inhibitor LprI family protein [Pseudomonas syringae pv. tomato]